MILAINTSTIQFGLALLSEQGAVVGEILISPGMKNYHALFPSLISLLASNNTEIGDLNAVVVAIGPGSFTGLRVGLSTAKGIAHGLQIPIIGVSCLEAMANQIPFARFPLCSMISSRKGEISMALFIWDNNQGMKRQTDDRSLKLEDLACIIHTPTLFVGDDLHNQGDSVKALLGENALLVPSHLWNLRASAVGTLGLKRALNNESDDVRELIPCYLRPPDVRPNPFQPRHSSS